MSYGMKWGAAALAGALAVCSPGVASAATLVIENDILIGATGVTVEGRSYDVRFVDGTCVGLFNGCDAPSDFTFTTAASALAASRALLDEMFILQFDFNPFLTRGCGGAGRCELFTPFERAADVNLVFVGQANNAIDQNGDTVERSQFVTSLDTQLENKVYAVWSVPEPGLTSLLVTGAGALLARRRRRGATQR